MSVDWGYYDKYEDISNQYMPDMGEGETLASQLVTAVNKLIYKWYNDGDVFETDLGFRPEWWNDLSSYANWLYTHIPESKRILYSVYACDSEDDYEELLRDLADRLLDVSILEKYDAMPKQDTIYKCDGKFKCEEDDWDDEENDEYYDEDGEEW